MSTDKILGLDTDNPYKYIGHGRSYPKATYKDGKIIFQEPCKTTLPDKPIRSFSLWIKYIYKLLNTQK